MLYTYLDEMKRDIYEAIKAGGYLEDKPARDDLEDTLNDELWANDNVTGNGSGSYFFNSYKALEAVHADGEDYFMEAVKEFCIPAETIAEHIFDYEWTDVTIRCYLLGQAIAEVLDEMEDELEQQEDE